MSQNPKVSVIIPTYNYGKYIKETLDSALAQTYKDYEIIVIDDGSTDNTKDIIADYLEKNEGIIRYIHQENQGASSARNTGIKNAKGEYIAFLDADDLWLPNKLELQIPLLDKDTNIGLVFGDAIPFGENCNIQKTSFQRYHPQESHKIFRQLFHENCIPTLTVVVKKVCFEKVGLFDESISIIEDYDMWLRIAKYYKVDYIDIPLAKYRLHAANISKINKEKEEKLLMDMIKVRKRALEKNPEVVKNMNISTLNKCYYKLYLNLAKFYLGFGSNNKASRKILQYIRFYPYNLVSYVLLLFSFMPAIITKFAWKLIAKF